MNLIEARNKHRAQLDALLHALEGLTPAQWMEVDRRYALRKRREWQLLTNVIADAHFARRQALDYPDAPAIRAARADSTVDMQRIHAAVQSDGSTDKERLEFRYHASNLRLSLIEYQDYWRDSAEAPKVLKILHAMWDDLIPLAPL